MPSRNLTSRLAPFATGVASVTVPADIDELNPPPFGCDGGCSSVVPLTVTLLVPLPHGGRSTVTTTDVDVRGRKSAMPLGAGNVVRSITRNRKRVTFPPVLLVTVLRMSNVPNVELFGGSEVKSRTRFGGDAAATQISRLSTAKEAFRSIGELRFSGPGAPRRWPAPADVPLVSTNTKSAALLFVSLRLPPVGQGPKVVIEPPLPQLSR